MEWYFLDGDDSGIDGTFAIIILIVIVVMILLCCASFCILFCCCCARREWDDQNKSMSMHLYACTYIHKYLLHKYIAMSVCINQNTYVRPRVMVVSHIA